MYPFSTFLSDPIRFPLDNNNNNNDRMYRLDYMCDKCEWIQVRRKNVTCFARSLGLTWANENIKTKPILSLVFARNEFHLRSFLQLYNSNKCIPTFSYTPWKNFPFWMLSCVGWEYECECVLMLRSSVGEYVFSTVVKRAFCYFAFCIPWWCMLCFIFDRITQPALTDQIKRDKS